MDFNFSSKNSTGVVATLVLVILLSQSRFFDFLIDTALGRAFLILFILGISYTNKILGVVAVLFIIIMFNQSSLAQLEGLTMLNPTPIGPIDNNDGSNKNEGREGSNTSEREHTMLKGKRSNEMPVFSATRNQDDNVEPSEKTSFTSIYTSV